MKTLGDSQGETQKAGGVVVKKEQGKVLVLLLYTALHKYWGFPKGHCEEGESAEQTAIREVQEECGIQVAVERRLPPYTYTIAQNGERVSCEMFLMYPKTAKLKTEFDGDILEWIPLEEVPDRITYDTLKTYFRSIAEEFEEKETF